MSELVKRIIYWMPRFLGFIPIILFTILAFSYLPSIVGFFAMFILIFIMAAILYVSWHNEKIGGIIYLLLAIGFGLFFGGYESYESFLVIPFPLIAIGGLFLYYHYYLE